MTRKQAQPKGEWLHQMVKLGWIHQFFYNPDSCCLDVEKRSDGTWTRYHNITAAEFAVITQAPNIPYTINFYTRTRCEKPTTALTRIQARDEHPYRPRPKFDTSPVT